jgi:hypothetical protein
MPRHTRAVLLAAAVIVPAGCNRTPERTIQVQGTVTSIGYGRPVPGADVSVEWPRALGGGGATMSTDEQGRFAIARTLRVDSLDCTGLRLTVRASGFASAFSNRDSSGASCGDSVLTMDFKLFPLQQ